MSKIATKEKSNLDIIQTAMAVQYCTSKLEDLSQLVHFHRTLLSTFCALNLAFSVLATLGNLLAIWALWKASSIPANLKTLFLSLAFADLSVGLIAQFVFGVVIALILDMTANGNYYFDFLCPTVLSICYFFLFLLACTSLLNLSTIALDRLLAIHLHLRYQELVTSKRVITAVVSFWLTSAVTASVFISLSSISRMVIAIVEVFGLLLTSVAYIRIYRAVRYHQNQIQSQFQRPADGQARELLRQKKSAFNALFVYLVFIACYLPHFCSVVLQIARGSRVAFQPALHASLFFILLNSSLNPIVYCWRYREIREIVKSTMKRMFRITET